MKYNGMEVHEAEGRDYRLGMTPKKMLVWDNAQYTPFERDVLGFFNGSWVAADSCGKGVCQWLHAAEIPTEETLPKQKLNNRAN